MAGDRIDRLDATGKARLTSDRATLDAPAIRIFFDDGAVERLIALGAARAPKDAVGDSVQARASAEGMRLVADSIDALSAGGQRIDSLYAVGQAYAEQPADTVQADLPAIAASDWARGDTIRAYFEAPPDSAAAPPPGDTAAARAVLKRLVVVGQSGAPAQTVYRARESGRPATERPSINYMVASSITIELHAGEVSGIDATGPVHGVHLQPRRPGTDSARTAPDSAAAFRDTAAAVRDTAAALRSPAAAAPDTAAARPDTTDVVEEVPEEGPAARASRHARRASSWAPPDPAARGGGPPLAETRRRWTERKR